MAINVKNLSTFNFNHSGTTTNTCSPSATFNNQYLYLTNTVTNQDTKLRLSDLVKTFKSYGQGATLFYEDNNSTITFKKLCTSTSLIEIQDLQKCVNINFLPTKLKLEFCDNTQSKFLKTVNLAADVKTTILPTSNGGTGLANTHVIGDLLYANTTTTLSPLASIASGNVLLSGGVAAIPFWGKVGLTTAVSGTLPISNGGTGITSFVPKAVVVADTNGELMSTVSATAGQILIGSNSGIPNFALLTSSDGSISFTAGNNSLSLSTRTSKLTTTEGADMLSSIGTNTSTAPYKTFSYLKKVTSIEVGTKILTSSDTGQLFTLNREEGIAITLPSASIGLVYEFHIITDFTGSCTITAGSETSYVGAVQHIDVSQKGTAVYLNANVAKSGWNIPAATDHILTLGTDASGRLAGGKLKFTGVSDSVWFIEGILFGSSDVIEHIFS